MSNSVTAAVSSIRLRSGLYLDLCNPDPSCIFLEDIAGGLSKLCRFGGQINEFYSVAEHSVLCSLVARNDGLSVDVQKLVLFHDASEAYCGDLVRPLKLLLPEYKRIELGLSLAIAKAFSLNAADHYDTIQEIDTAVMMAERRTLFSQDSVLWTDEATTRQVDVAVKSLAPRDAERLFMEHAAFLGTEMV